MFHREQAAVAPKACTKLSAQDRKGSRSCPAVCRCKAVQTGVRTVVQAPQSQVSSLSERDMTFKQAEGKGVDHSVTVSVRLERRTWAFHFVKNDMLPSPVQICSHQLLVKASSEVSQISQDMWIYGIHSSSPCWDKDTWSGLGCKDTENLQKIAWIPTPKNLLAPNTFSCHWLQKRNSVLCFLLLHNLACKSMCLSLAQQLFTWF